MTLIAIPQVARCVGDHTRIPRSAVSQPNPPCETSQPRLKTFAPELGVSGINSMPGFYGDKPDPDTTPAQSADKYGKNWSAQGTVLLITIDIMTVSPRGRVSTDSFSTSGNATMNDNLREFFIQTNVPNLTWIRSTPKVVGWISSPTP